MPFGNASRFHNYTEFGPHGRQTNLTSRYFGQHLRAKSDRGSIDSRACDGVVVKFRCSIRFLRGRKTWNLVPSPNVGPWTMVPSILYLGSCRRTEVCANLYCYTNYWYMIQLQINCDPNGGSQRTFASNQGARSTHPSMQPL